MLTERVKQDIVTLLTERVNPSFILLYGSHSKGKEKEDSDVDLAYYSESVLSAYEQFLLAGELAEICGRDVDLVNLREADHVFAMQVFSAGVLLAVFDENEFVKQRMRAYRMYADLNEKRAGILQAIHDRGSVFGDT